MTEEPKVKHPSLEAEWKSDPSQILSVETGKPLSEVTTSIASLEKQHESNQAEIKQLEEIKQILEVDQTEKEQLLLDIMRLIKIKMEKK